MLEVVCFRHITVLAPTPFAVGCPVSPAWVVPLCAPTKPNSSVYVPRVVVAKPLMAVARADQLPAVPVAYLIANFWSPHANLNAAFTFVPLMFGVA